MYFIINQYYITGSVLDNWSWHIGVSLCWEQVWKAPVHSQTHPAAYFWMAPKAKNGFYIKNIFFSKEYEMKFKFKFYWNTAMLIGLCTVYSRVWTAETETSKPKIFTIWPFTEKHLLAPMLQLRMTYNFSGNLS